MARFRVSTGRRADPWKKILSSCTTEPLIGWKIRDLRSFLASGSTGSLDSGDYVFAYLLACRCNDLEMTEIKAHRVLYDCYYQFVRKRLYRLVV